MKLAQESLRELIPLLNERIGNLLIPPGRRAQLAVSCFAIALEHQHAIAGLLEWKLHASAFALVRPLLEATVKGTWIAHSATDSAIEKHARGGELPAVSDMLSHLRSSRLPPEVQGLLAFIKSDGWQIFSSLTHAGFAQVRRWVSPTGVEPTYPEEELEEVANLASLLGLISCLEAARLSGNQEVVAELASFIPAESSNES